MDSYDKKQLEELKELDKLGRVGFVKILKIHARIFYKDSPDILETLEKAWEQKSPR